LEQKYLSDIELYYSTNVANENIELIDDEFIHASKVRLHVAGDIIHVTDGMGNYFESIISVINKNSIIGKVKQKKSYYNKFHNIYFCFPRLKSTYRFEFEMEKLVELGITNFIIFNSERTIAKGEKIERWNKIALTAMKQSLRTFKPKIEYYNSIEKINLLDGINIILEQKGEDSLINFLNKTRVITADRNSCFIFGPEGGLSKNEISLIKNCKLLTLTPNRLRAETAVIATATAIALL